MWQVALQSWQWIHQVAAPCNVIRGSGITCRWIRPVAAPYNVTHSSWINVAGGCGMTCHWIRPNVRPTGILHLVSILTISPQSTCHSAPVSEMSSKSDHPRQKMTSRQFSRWRISAISILDFKGPIMGHIARSSPREDHHRALAACIRQVPPDWKRPAGRPSHIF